MKNIHSKSKQLSGGILAIILSLCIALSMLITDIPVARASDETQVTEAPQTTETPQQPEEPQATETPQPTKAPQPTEAPQIVEVDGAQCVDGEVIVKFKNTVSDTAAESTLDAAGGEVKQELPVDDLLVSDVPEGETVEDFIDTLETQPSVEYVQPNFAYALEAAVNDPGASSQWHLNKIGAYSAWDITMGISGIRVAVLDTGIDLDHPDLAGQIDAQTDVVDNDGSADDDDGHGTHVAGIIAAKANNGVGVAGIAPGVRLVVVDVFGPEYAYTTDIIKGLNYATSQGADVINMSFGSYESDSAFEAAVNQAAAAGAVCVAAAGNEGTTAYCCPSDYDACVSVIATTSDDLKASWSNYGSLKDISAPGNVITSTYLNGQYASMNGTSMASPVIAGVVALVRSANPGLSAAEVKNILYSTTADLGASGRDDSFGYGRVDAYAAVTAAAGVPIAAEAPTETPIVNTPVVEALPQPPPPAPVQTVSALPASYNSITVSWAAISGASGYQVYRSTSPDGNYRLVKTTSSLSFKNKSLKTGTAYFYKVRAYRKSGRTKIYDDYFGFASATPMLANVSGASASATSPTAVKVSWSKVSGRSGYEVWRSTAPDSGFALVKSTSGTTYKNTKLPPFTAYYYMVRAYRKVGGVRVYSAFTAVTGATPILGDVSGVSAARSSATKIKVSWRKVPGASGYEVWRSASPDSGFTLVKSTSSRRYTNTKLTAGVTYYYKVRAYVKVGKAKVYSADSAVVSATP